MESLSSAPLPPAVASLVLILVLGAPLPFCVWMGQRLRRDALEAPDPTTSRFLHDLVVVWCSAQLIVGHVLGVAGLFRLDALVAAELALLGCGLVLQRATAWPDRELRLSAAERVAVAGVAGVTLVAVIRTLAIMPGTYDSYGYHLPEVARWLTRGDLSIWPSSEASSLSYYSYGWDVASGMFALIFRSDYLVMFPNVAVLAMLMLANYRLARAAGADRSPAIWAAALSATAPASLKNVTGVMADVALAAAFMSAVAYGVELAGGNRWSRLPLLILCIGMAAGVKTSGPSYGMLAVLVTAVAWSEQRGWILKGLKGLPIGWTLATGAAAVFLGAFWVTRNVIYAGIVMPPIPDAAAMFATTLAGKQGWSRSEVLVTAQGLVEGTGFLLVGIAAMLSFQPESIAGSSDRVRCRLTLWGAALGSLVVFGVTPYSATNTGVITAWFSAQAVRHGLSLVAVVAVSAVVAAKRPWLGARARLMHAILLCCLAGQLYLCVVLRVVPYRDFSQQLLAVWSYLTIASLTAALVFLASRGRVMLCRQHFVGAAAVAAAMALACFPIRESARSAWLDGAQLEVSRRLGDNRAFFLGGKWPYVAMGAHFEAQVFAVGGDDRLGFGANFDGRLVDLLAAMERTATDFAVAGPFDRREESPGAVVEGLASGQLKSLVEVSGVMILQRDRAVAAVAAPTDGSTTHER